MLLYDALDPVDVGASHADAAFQRDGVQPELGDLIVPLDMHVRGLIPVTQVEERSERTISK